MGTRAVIVASLAALALAGGAPASSSLTGVERAALTRLARAPIDPATKRDARAQIARAARLVRTLPNGRGYHVAVALREAAFFPGALTKPRALELYGALRANNDYFSRHWAPADKTDIVGADGTVYRYFGGYSFRFHPLANFGVLNALVASGDVEGTAQLADALLARGVYQRGGGIAWEYDFAFGGGRAPWLSGMAQAVAAQAFARAAQLVPERATAYLREAQAAYRVIPRRLLVGSWIRLYSFSSLQVLNAQLQAVLSLRDYTTTAGDAAAGALATRMENAAAAMLPRFDTGYWSYYALPREASPPDYHRYVVQLLAKLAKLDGRFADAAKRFAAYEKQPPAFQLANGGVGEVRFWLSKPATVVADTAAGPSKRVAFLDGWHTLTWQPKQAGVFRVHVRATDWNGNRAEFDALPIVRVGKGLTVTPTTTAEQAAPFAVLPRLVQVWQEGAAPAPVATAYVELDAATPPSASFPQYAAALAQQSPSLRYLVVGLEATAALNDVRNAVHAVRPDVAVGPVVEGLRPGSLMVADVVALRGPQPNRGVLTQTFATVPPIVLENPSAPAIRAAACDPAIAGVALDPGVGDVPALAAAVRGTVVCPGLAAPAAASTTSFPASVTSGAPVAFQLGCVRDCLYLVTLVAADGRPVVATRGALRGGAPAKTITLPKTSLGQPSYTIDVRLVSRVNPGAATEIASPGLSRAPS